MPTGALPQRPPRPRRAGGATRAARPRTGLPALLLSGLPALALALLVILAIAAQLPPAAVDATAPPDVFSAERALEHVRVIAREPHAVGTAANAAVRDYLLAELHALALETEVQRATAVSERFAVTGVVENVLGRLRGVAAPGGGAGPSVLLVAHYDSVTSTPGAADNGAAVAAILEALRALSHGAPLANDVLVLFSDAEEVGLLGAEAFAQEHPWMDEVALVINLEARGTSGPSVLVETTPGNAGLMRTFAAVDPYPNASSMSFEIYDVLPNDTDFTVFKERGVPGYNFAFIRELAHYHAVTDSVENLSPRSLQHHGEHLVALTRHYAAAHLGAALLTEGDAIYFDVLRRAMVRYPASWAIPSAVVALLALLGAAALARARGLARPAYLALGAALTLLAAVSAGAAAWLVLTLLARFAAGYRSAPMPTPYGAEITMVALALLGVLVVVLTASLSGRLLRPLEAILGAYAIWALLALGVSVALPGGSYLFVWPTLGGALALAVVIARSEHGAWSPSAGDAAVLMVGMLPAVLLLPPFLAEGFIGLSLALAPVLVALIALAASLLLAALGGPHAAGTRALPAVLAVAAVIALVAGVRAATFDEERPFPVNAFYVVDPALGEARFVSFVAEPDAWTASFFGDARVTDLTDLLPDAWPMRSAPAPVLALTRPNVDLIDDTTLGDARRLTLRVASTRDASQLTLLIAPWTPVEGVRLNGRSVQRLTRPNGWTRLVVYGRVGDGVEVELVTRAGAEVDVVVIDATNDLHAHADLSVPERPPGTMPAPSRLSDAVLVVRSWSTSAPGAP